MTLRPGKFVRNSGTTAQDARFTEKVLWARNADGTIRSGLTGVSGNIIGGRTDRTLTVNAFTAVAERAGQGVYEWVNDGAVQSPALAASPASNSRIDILYTVQQDGGTGGAGDSASTSILGVLTGTAAASPIAPTLTVPGAVELARVTVPAGAANTNAMTIQNTYARTATTGSVVLLRDRAELDAWAAADGQTALTENNSVQWQRIGGTWRSVSPWGGSFDLNSDANGYVTITHTLGAVPSRASGILAYRDGISEGVLSAHDLVLWELGSTYVRFRLRRLDTRAWATGLQPVRVNVTAWV